MLRAWLIGAALSPAGRAIIGAAAGAVVHYLAGVIQPGPLAPLLGVAAQAATHGLLPSASAPAANSPAQPS